MIYKVYYPTELYHHDIKELKKDGYNAVFDDNANSPAPFIVFNPKDLEQTGSKKIG